MIVLESDDVTPCWLTRVLREAGVLTVQRVSSAECVSLGTGQVAGSFRYLLSYDGTAGPASVVVKMASADPVSRAIGIQLELYRREVLFYRRLAPRLGIRTPELYYAALDGDRFLLLMEDLTPAAAVDQLTGISADQAALALAQAAAMHAPLWGSAWLADQTWLHGASNTDKLALNVLADQFLERYADTLDPATHAVIERIAPRAPEFGRVQPGPWTVQHGDYRPDNMLFDGRDGEVPLTVVDWQTVRNGPALIDIAFLLGTSLDTKTRRAAERDLVRDYHVRLGVPGYDWDTCWADYRRYALYAVFFLVPAAVLVQRTGRGDEMFRVSLARATAQITDLESEELLC